MSFNLNFDTDNAAFAGDGKVEVIRILKQVISYLQRDEGTRDGILMDYNGNRIGQWSLELPDNID
jgi:hypothetical protein